MNNPVWTERLRDEMLANGFSMKSLSVAAGQNETFVRDILARQKSPSVDKLQCVAKVLGVSVGYLLGETEAKKGGANTLDPESALRSALLAFGVDREDVSRAVSMVKVFVDDLDEQSPPSPPGDQSEPASPRRGSVPSGKRVRQPSS